MTEQNPKKYKPAPSGRKHSYPLWQICGYNTAIIREPCVTTYAIRTDHTEDDNGMFHFSESREQKTEVRSGSGAGVTPLISLLVRSERWHANCKPANSYIPWRLFPTFACGRTLVNCRENRAFVLYSLTCLIAKSHGFQEPNFVVSSAC